MVLMHLKTIHILLKLFYFCKCQCIVKMLLTSIHLFLLLKTLFLHMFVIFINEFCTINLSDGHLLGAQNCNGNESIRVYKLPYYIYLLIREFFVPGKSTAIKSLTEIVCYNLTDLSSSFSIISSVTNIKRCFLRQTI